MENLKKIWPEWRVIEKVGEGSFGKVYKCVRDDYGITLYSAVKVITIPQNESEINNLRLEGMSESETRTYFEGIVNDFANEIKMMVLLRNAPNIVPVENYAIVEHEGKIGWSIYIRMEYLTPFGDYVFKNKIDEAEVKKFGLDMCSALEVCAKKDIIHRDIKPDNIFIDEYGNYRLGDFGVARQLENTVGSMSKKGTYSYMAPEVYRSGKYDNRADIYSLGMVMYKLLNNNRDPFLDPHKPNLLFGDRQHALERRMNGERFSAPCNASAKMAEIILKAVEFRPEDRFANVEEFKNALNALNAPVTADEPTVAARDFEEKTVAARDFELPKIEPEKVDFGDETVVINARDTEESTLAMSDEPTVVNGDEDTVVDDNLYTIKTNSSKETVSTKVPNVAKKTKYIAIDEILTENKADPDATLIADEATDIGDGKTEKKHNSKKKFLFWGVACFVCIIFSVALLFLFADDITLSQKYSKAEKLAAEGKYDEAIVIFTELEGYKNSEGQIKTANYGKAEKLVAENRNFEAAIAYGKAGDYYDARERSFALWDEIADRETVAGHCHTVGIKSDGTVVAVGRNDDGQCNIDGWTDIVAVSAGGCHTVGLKSDGTVVAVGRNDDGQCNIDGWTDIVAISASDSLTVGLKSDGTVIATGWNYYSQCDVDGWSDIVAVAAGRKHTVALKADGTVVAVGCNDDGQCNINGWTDIVAISASETHTVGLKSDGTVVAVGLNLWEEQCDVDGWTDIVAVSTDDFHTVGLKADGTVVAVGSNGAGRCDVDGWKDIVAVAAGLSHTVGLKSDGTVVAVGDTGYDQCDVGGWKNIKLPK